MTPPTGPQRILIADDEEIIAKTLGAIFAKEGFEVRVVYSGQEAVNQAALWQPQFFLSDVVMPGMSGIEAAILIRQICPECRILLISGRAVTTELLADARRRGHDFEALPKPTHPAVLLERFRYPGRPPSPREI